MNGNNAMLTSTTSVMVANVYQRERETMEVDRTVRLALTFSEALRRWQMSVYRLSKDAGVALKTTQKIVAGQSPEPSFWSVVDLARALGVSLEALAVAPRAKPAS
jgi:hypothetical protein